MYICLQVCLYKTMSIELEFSISFENVCTERISTSGMYFQLEFIKYNFVVLKFVF